MGLMTGFNDWDHAGVYNPPPGDFFAPRAPRPRRDRPLAAEATQATPGGDAGSTRWRPRAPVTRRLRTPTVPDGAHSRPMGGSNVVVEQGTSLTLTLEVWLPLVPGTIRMPIPELGGCGAGPVRGRGGL